MFTGKNGGHMVTYRTYFLNPETMRLQLDLMWEEDDAVSELGQGLLCPSQRRMPDFGSMTAEVIASGLHAVRMLFEILMTGPAVFTPGVYSRIQTMSNMPLNYGHSFLLNEGMGWLNFDPVFEALRRAHNHFWGSFTKIGSLFDDAPYVNQFMNGLALHNQDYTPLVTRRMKRYLGAADRAASAVDKQVNGMVQSIAGKNPVVFTGLSASTGMLNMAQYALRMLRTLFVSMLLPGLDALAAGESGIVVVHGLWHVLYEAQVDYKTLILASELRSCVGLQLMLGQTNPFGRFAGSVCEAGVWFKLGVIETALVFFVDIPMLACVCHDSQQVDYRQWVVDHCYEAAPVHFKGVLRGIIDSTDTLEALCKKSSSRVQQRIGNSMDQFLTASHRASDVLGDCVDFMRFVWDKDAGTCRDYAGDPYVTTIIADPIDFWRICAWTKSCKAKCSGSMQAFETAKKTHGVTIRDVRRATSQRTIESAFFNDDDILQSRSIAPFDILDIVELNSCYFTCGSVSEGNYDRCVGIMGIE
jgi:hypothetical protein